MTENPLKDVTQGLVVNPGDTLVLGFSRLLRDAEADDVLRHIRNLLPDVHVVLVPGVDNMAIVPLVDKETLQDTVREIMEQEWEAKVKAANIQPEVDAAWQERTSQIRNAGFNREADARDRYAQRKGH